MYFNSKVELAKSILLTEREFIQYVIYGIPDRQIRTTANMMRFKTKEDLLSSLLLAELPPVRPAGSLNVNSKPNEEAKGNLNEKQKLRCYNCNCGGHMAANCRKPKREEGACYGCGKMDHKVADCTENKKKKDPTNSYGSSDYSVS
ncbi:ATP-dependent RNA helicase glh-4-like [Drosophila ananassae]|uniref:ATP-dependent RNA helicase glh-4-like n=1 Tax=Drosophila ananassae TaxID=7217 RepID=UPI0013A5C71A|nr:ATP-dependent RNA helicase glh-4-like [Drosophila ananassae]